MRLLFSFINSRKLVSFHETSPIFGERKKIRETRSIQVIVDLISLTNDKKSCLLFYPTKFFFFLNVTHTLE
jgi:hypothetical protein